MFAVSHINLVFLNDHSGTTAATRIKKNILSIRPYMNQGPNFTITLDIS